MEQQGRMPHEERGPENCGKTDGNSTLIDKGKSHWSKPSKPSSTHSYVSCSRWPCLGRILDWMIYRSPFQQIMLFCKTRSERSSMLGSGHLFAVHCACSACSSHKWNFAVACKTAGHSGWYSRDPLLGIQPHPTEWVSRIDFRLDLFSFPDGHSTIKGTVAVNPLLCSFCSGPIGLCPDHEDTASACVVITTGFLLASLYRVPLFLLLPNTTLGSSLFFFFTGTQSHPL